MGVSRAWGHVETADCIYWAGMQRHPSRPASTGEESEEANLAKCARHCSRDNKNAESTPLQRVPTPSTGLDAGLRQSTR